MWGCCARGPVRLDEVPPVASCAVRWTSTGPLSGGVQRSAVDARGTRPAGGSARQTAGSQSPVALTCPTDPRPGCLGKVPAGTGSSDGSDREARLHGDPGACAAGDYLGKIERQFIPQDLPSSLPVTHLLPERPVFVRAVGAVSNLGAVLPKPKREAVRSLPFSTTGRWKHDASAQSGGMAWPLKEIRNLALLSCSLNRAGPSWRSNIISMRPESIDFAISPYTRQPLFSLSLFLLGMSHSGVASTLRESMLPASP